MIEINVHHILSRYHQLLDQPAIKKFILQGGELCLATERIPVHLIEALYSGGHRFFAEKYGQELRAKRQWLNHCKAIRFNFFGAIQTNKLKKIISDSAILESIDSKYHALKVQAALGLGLNQLQRCYVQVNTGREPQKRGVWPEHADELIGFCKDLGLPISGLMCIPPRHADARQDYAFLRKLADAYHLEHCQMGFSHDYKTAIECGATAIRVGSLVFKPHA
jgi:PLP dependent protein